MAVTISHDLGSCDIEPPLYHVILLDLGLFIASPILNYTLPFMSFFRPVST